MRTILGSLLLDLGHQVVGEAANGQQAVERYQELKPDVVTMDLTMPHMDGLQAIDEIMALDPQARIIVCSALAEKRTIRNALERGAKDYILKPFHGARVASTMEKVLTPRG